MLDLGCGRGRLSAQLAARGHDVVGVDINRDAISEAEGAEFYVRDVASELGLGLPGLKFHAVVCQLVISVVGGRDERRALLRNAFDALEPSGVVYVSASGVSDAINPAYAALYEQDLPSTGEQYTYLSRDSAGRVLYATHHFTVDELTSFMESAGFIETHVAQRSEASSRRPDEAAYFLYATARKPG